MIPQINPKGVFRRYFQISPINTNLDTNKFSNIKISSYVRSTQNKQSIICS